MQNPSLHKSVKLCRICLVNRAAYDIFSPWPDGRQTGLSNLIAWDIETISGIKIKITEERFICKKCLVKLREASKFVYLVKTSDCKLKYQPRDVTKKHEWSNFFRNPQNIQVALKKNSVQPTSSALEETSKESSINNTKEQIFIEPNKRLQGLKLRNIVELTKANAMLSDTHNASLTESPEELIVPDELESMKSKVEEVTTKNYENEINQLELNEIDQTDLVKEDKKGNNKSSIKEEKSEQNNETEFWPLPIKLETSVSNFLLPSDVKEEILSDEDENRPQIEIKIEPVEYTESNIQIVDCYGSVPFDSPSQYNNKNKLNKQCLISSVRAMEEEPGNQNDFDTYTEVEYLEPIVKKEKEGEEEEKKEEEKEVESKIPLRCLLCAKALRCVSGLKAHVIAKHSYESVYRNAGRPSLEPRPSEEYVCQTSKNVLESEAALRLHDVTCCVCGSRFSSTELLALHRAHCANGDKNNTQGNQIVQSEGIVVKENLDRGNIEDVKKSENELINLKEKKNEDIVMEEVGQTVGQTEIVGQKIDNETSKVDNKSNKRIENICSSNCSVLCHERFTKLHLSKLRRQFASMSSKQKMMTYRKFVHTTQNGKGGKNFFYYYQLPGANGKLEPVCSMLFARTLGVQLRQIRSQVRKYIVNKCHQGIQVGQRRGQVEFSIRGSVDQNSATRNETMRQPVNPTQDTGAMQNDQLKMDQTSEMPSAECNHNKSVSDTKKVNNLNGNSEKIDSDKKVLIKVEF